MIIYLAILATIYVAVNSYFIFTTTRFERNSEVIHRNWQNAEAGMRAERQRADDWEKLARELGARIDASQPQSDSGAERKG